MTDRPGSHCECLRYWRMALAGARAGREIRTEARLALRALARALETLATAGTPPA